MPDQGNELASSKVCQGLVRLSGFIDSITNRCGQVISWLILPMVLSLVYEVASRYLLSAPTIWAEDVSTMLYGSFFMLGAAYTLKEGKHIRTDFFYQNWSPRTKGTVDSLIYLLVFFPTMIFFLFISMDYAAVSFEQQERSISSPWMPFIWPVKMTMPISVFLLLIQGVSELAKSLVTVVTGEEPRKAGEQGEI